VLLDDHFDKQHDELYDEQHDERYDEQHDEHYHYDDSVPTEWRHLQHLR
jgi:hypothetical protein